MRTPTRVAWLVAIAAALATPALSAAQPAADEMARRMQLVLWPDRPSTRDLAFTVSAERNVTKLTAAEARTGSGAGKRLLLVILSPPGAKGMAWLVQPGPEETVQWLYHPHLDRVRKILPVQGFESFMTTEYTYADLGLVDLHVAYKLLGEETREGAKVYRLEAVPSEPWYYSRVVTWVAADSFAPMAREYYDRAGALWKAERFGPVTNVGGVPTILERRIEDKQTGGSTAIAATNVKYDVTLPDGIFDPTKLPQASTRRPGS